MKNVEYPLEDFEKIRDLALEAVLASGEYGCEFTQDILDFLKERYGFAVAYYSIFPKATCVELHNYWLKEKLENGWKHAKLTHNKKKISSYIFPFQYLDEKAHKEYGKMREVILSLLRKYQAGKPLLIAL